MAANPADSSSLRLGSILKGAGNPLLMHPLEGSGEQALQDPWGEREVPAYTNMQGRIRIPDPWQADFAKQDHAAPGLAQAK